MNKTIQHTIRIMMVFFMLMGTAQTAYASEGEEYITISVEAEDNSGTLLYALDTDAPEAFSPSNEFSIPAGTNHTIYVKDSAGNITSQEYISSSDDPEKADTGDEEEGRAVNIDITLDDSPKTEPDYSDYEYAGDLLYDPVEEGEGTVYEKVGTSANDPNAERIFYTVTTDEGEVFYLVIDQGQSSNNVYLLDQVKVSDLRALAKDDSGKSGSTESSSLLSALNGGNENSSKDELLTEEEDAPPAKSSMGGNLLILLLIAAVGGGFYYYKNVYKNKKDEQMDLIDALDREDFEAEEEEDDEADFGLDDDYQERLMQELMEEDEPDDEENYPYEETMSRQEMEPESGSPEEESAEEVYATSHRTESVEEDGYDEDLDSPDEEE